MQLAGARSSVAGVFSRLPYVDLLQLFHAAKGHPVEDGVLHPHHQSRGDHKLPVFVIDLVHGLGDLVQGGGEELQLFVRGVDEVVDADSQVSHLLWVAGAVEEAQGLNIDVAGGVDRHVELAANVSPGEVGVDHGHLAGCCLAAGAADPGDTMVAGVIGAGTAGFGGSGCFGGGRLASNAGCNTNGPDH
jgi:hypothetical protein